MQKEANEVSRREFLKTSGGAVAASVVANPSEFSPRHRSGRRKTQMMRYAIVGTGVRAIGMWGRDVAQEYANEGYPALQSNEDHIAVIIRDPETPEEVKQIFVAEGNYAARVSNGKHIKNEGDINLERNFDYFVYIYQDE